ncbi:MAG TPA: hypothetical protein VHD89_11410, partial [Rhodanobacteraceae bacterium]|nr:hypothetical protein [Rhodanobacteraceae bacterium]
MRTDAMGARSFSLYDAQGRLAGTVEADGTLTEYCYDAQDRASRTITYAAACDLTKLVNASGVALDPALNAVRPATSAADRSTWSAWDAAGRLARTVDGNGNVVEYAYDGAGLVVQTREYANALSASARSALGNAPAPAAIAPTANAAGDRITRSFYDADGLLIGTLDANGYLQELTYDADSELVQKTRYATLTASSRLTDSFATLKAAASAGTGHVTTTWLRDGKGQIVAEIDGENYLTEYAYDAAGRQVSVLRHANRVSVAYTGASTPGSVRPAASPDDQLSSCSYDALGRVVSATDALGHITRSIYRADEDGPAYVVDAAGGVTGYRYDATGRVTQVRQYARTAAGVSASSTASQLDAQMACRTDASDAIDNRLYDLDGRLAASINGLGEVTRYGYDANGNLIDERTYAQRVAGWAPGSAIVTTDSATDRRVRTLYDAFNRAVYTLEATGAVTTYRYDANGNVLEQRAYAKAIDPASFDGTKVVLPMADAADSVTTNLYDSHDRLSFSADGLGGVTRFTYDNAGHVTQQARYAKAVAPGTSPDSAVATPGQDRITNYSYDAFGQRLYEVDSLGNVVGYTYDGNGNVTQTRAYFKPLAAKPVLGSPPASISPTSTSGLDRVTRRVYDAANRLVATVEATGAVVQSSFDGAGNLTQVKRFAKLLTTAQFAALSSKPTWADIDAVVGRDATADRTTTQHFDAANRLADTSDDAGHITSYGYDGVGRLTSQAQNNTTSVGARTTLYSYDGAGRTLSVRDALGNTETYTFDGAGNKLSYTDANGASWRYTSDAAGRITDEASPTVAVTVLSEQGLKAPEQVSVRTRYAYDALGRMTARTEAAGRPEARTTIWRYDALGRVIRTDLPRVGVYAGETDAALARNGQGTGASRVETVPAAIYSETYYDALGNEVGSRDVGGVVSYRLYDVLGRIVTEVDALRNVTQYGYSAFGEVQTVTRRAKPVSVTGSPMQLASVTISTDAANDRVLASSYDALGRVVQVQQAAVSMYDPDASGAAQNYTAQSTTITSYNAFGEVVKTATLKNKAGEANTEYRWYDQAGNLQATLDAGGYLTRYAYDGVGNLQERTEFATPCTGAISGSAPPSVAASSKDRLTQYGWDALHRKVSESQKLDYTDQDTFAQIAGGMVTTTYGYDGVGNPVSTTVAGNTSYTYYDALGRITAAVSPLDASRTQLTQYLRDGRGNVVYQVARAAGANGASAASAQSYLATSSPDDRAQATVFDALGRAVEVQDAEHIRRYFSYDARGNLAKSWFALQTDAGART